MLYKIEQCCPVILATLITTKGATTATVTKENWREYVRERLSNSKMRSCMRSGIDG